ncbi:MAG: hypothetical protein ACC682_04720 [Gemmatimonadota bacterium]
MSYAVYITRARHHLEGPQVPIPREDWHVLIESDPGLTPTKTHPDLARWSGPCGVDDPRIDWANGNLFSRNPDHSVVRKLVDIAGLLGGHVQGDGGELYSIERGQVVREDPSNESGVEGGLAAEELEAALGALATHNTAVLDTGSGDAGPEGPNASFACPPDEALEREKGRLRQRVPFKVGQRVRTPWGHPGTIVAIDPDGDSGMGHIEIRYDDGRTATTSCVAHGLDRM